MPRCNTCNTSFHYCNSCGHDGHSEEGFCSSECRDKYLDIISRPELNEICIERYGFPDFTVHEESDEYYIIKIPKVYPYKRGG